MPTLRDHLDLWAGADTTRRAVAATVAALAAGAAELAALIAGGPYRGDLAATVGDSRDGDGQKVLDVRADAIFTGHLRRAPVAVLASEEQDDVVRLHDDAPLAVALDPLDGSNNVTNGATMGTVFSVLACPADGSPAAAFAQPGTRQLAGGFVIYGPYVALALSVGEGTHVFILDPATRLFEHAQGPVRIPEARREYAINAANRRHWPLPVRAFVEECVAGADGPRGVDYNTRWLGCVVAEAYRILLRGGIYLYPGDSRPGYERGRLRLLYEAAPIAMVFEAAGGAATDGVRRILDLAPATLHQRVPLVFGSADKVERLTQLHEHGVPQAGQRPLFSQRGLFHS